jgi:23S rRNA pseudouridine955/2504/2580 synthase
MELYYGSMNSVDRQILGQDDDGRRFDRILRIMLRDMPLSAIHKALRKGEIRINGSKMPPDYHCCAGDVIEFSRMISLPSTLEHFIVSSIPNANPTPVSLPILIETRDLLFLNKPLGRLVHDGPDSLNAMVGTYLAGKLDASLAFSPGPLHRLDRNTSGVITFSRSLAGAKTFSESMRHGSIQKTYIAILHGKLDNPTVWKDAFSRDSLMHKSFIDSGFDEMFASGKGKTAITEIHPLLAGKDIMLAALRLQTGRTHQIRVQAAAHGCPLIGDTKYGGERSEAPYYLHAWELSFGKTLFPDVPMKISAPLPHHFIEKLYSSFAVTENEVYSVMRQFRF